MFAFLLALVHGYFVLAAQFSFRDPLTIMLTVPLALAGAPFALMFGKTLNIFSEIGIIMLIGRHEERILMLSFQSAKEGMRLLEAAKHGQRRSAPF
jgi:multidrug efflux pump subunit AcrB